MMASEGRTTEERAKGFLLDRFDGPQRDFLDTGCKFPTGNLLKENPWIIRGSSENIVYSIGWMNTKQRMQTSMRFDRVTCSG